VRAQLKTLRANSPAAFPPEHKERRTAIAALELFRDQVLTKDHEGVESGEWCSPAEVTAIIKQLQQEIDHV
jgi:hypothetical protein